MVKYYCDKCGEEISDIKEMKRVQINCSSLIGRPIVKFLHKECAIELIGKEIVEEEGKRREARIRELKERKTHNDTSNRKND